MFYRKLEARPLWFALLAVILVSAPSWGEEAETSAAQKEIVENASAAEAGLADGTIDPVDEGSCSDVEGPVEPQATEGELLMNMAILETPASGCGGYPGCFGACASRGTPGDPCVCQCTCEC